MKLRGGMRFALGALFLVVFNVLFFLLVDVREASQAVWVSWGFIHFAYVMLLLTPLLVRRGSASAVYSRSVWAVTGSYFVIELACGVGVMVDSYAEDPVLSDLSAVVVQTILAAVFVGVLLVVMMVNLRTAETSERGEVESRYVGESAAQLAAIMRRVEDKTLERKIERAFDLIRSSPVRSDEAVAALERGVMKEIGGLEHAAAQGDAEEVERLVDRICELAGERNQTLRRIR